uniref:Putative secreted protein n=1 Tax=Ixodes ricinus TaxID=34613 RepID=A0A6B0TU81_IXORI
MAPCSFTIALPAVSLSLASCDFCSKQGSAYLFSCLLAGCFTLSLVLDLLPLSGERNNGNVAEAMRVLLRQALVSRC